MSPTMCDCFVSLSAQLVTAVAANAYNSARSRDTASPLHVRGRLARSGSSHALTPVTSVENCPCHM
ncbi:hypothetical protein PF008_g21057 [Phytophthora fragariae]|uniref:Secreted protein n=1 Tax=Phytophthora fragariae TaxID=53985 RepID=A0A6G0QXN6_9STRA|nr:hypothetical protein PF008_g21057 [Phytophthora fragariae]